MIQKKWSLFLLIVSVYILCSLWGTGVNAMQLNVVSLTMALAKTRNIIIDSFIISNYDSSFYMGHFYSGVAPGLSFLVVPHYLIFSCFTNNVEILIPLFSITSTALCVSSSLYFLYLLLRDMGLSEKESRSLTYLCAFGTLFLVYGSSFDSRAIASSLSIVVFYLLYHFRNILNKRNGVLSIVIGSLLGIIPAFNYASALLIPVFSFYFIYIIIRDRHALHAKKYSRILLYFIGLSVPLYLLMKYHYSAFGNYFLTPYSFRYDSLWHNEGIAGFTYPKIKPLFHLLLLPYRGLLFYMPIFMLSFISLFFSMRKKNLELIISGFCMLMFIVYNSGLKRWSGEWCFGPRLLVEAIPFSIILAAPIIRMYKKVYYSIFMYSVAINFLGVNFRYAPNLDRPLLAIVRYILEFISSGFRYVYSDAFIIAGIFPRPEFFIKIFVKSSVFGLLLLLISSILFNFQFRSLLIELSKAVRKISGLTILKNIILSMFLGFIGIALNKLFIIVKITSYRMLFISFVNIFMMISFFSIFKDIIFKHIISIENE